MKKIEVRELNSFIAALRKLKLGAYARIRFYYFGPNVRCEASGNFYGLEIRKDPPSVKIKFAKDSIEMGGNTPEKFGKLYEKVVIEADN